MLFKASRSPLARRGEVYTRTILGLAGAGAAEVARAAIRAAALQRTAIATGSVVQAVAVMAAGAPGIEVEDGTELNTRLVPWERNW